MASAQTPKEKTDCEIVQQVLEGEKESFGVLVKRYQNLCCRLAGSMLGDFHNAEDVVQEAFIIAYENLERLSNPAGFAAWVAGITKNLCRNFLRDRKKEPVSVEDLANYGDEPSGSGDATAFRRELTQAVQRLMARLPEKYRHVLQLRYTEGYSCQKLADFLGLSRTATISRLFYARKRLTKMLQKEGWKTKPSREDRKMNNRTGFTLIELLIVVAIIGILAGIAVPNFLLAQTKAKVAQAQSELRTLGTALEAYHVDNNEYPVWLDGNFLEINPTSRRLASLTSPVSYVKTIPAKDPFQDRTQPETYDTYDYVDAESFARRGDLEPSYRSRGAVWRLCSPGPDQVNTYGGPVDMNSWDNPGYDYDPTNGVVSNGDICRVGSRSEYTGNYLYPNQVY